MRCNVDLLKIIQVGITLANEDGEFPQDCSTWQFNFRFSLRCVVVLLLSEFSFLIPCWVSEDMFTPESVEQLQKAGLDFQRHEEFGIIPNDFAELMITSGMVLSQDTRWISFHRYARIWLATVGYQWLRLETIIAVDSAPFCLVCTFGSWIIIDAPSVF